MLAVITSRIISRTIPVNYSSLFVSCNYVENHYNNIFLVTAACLIAAETLSIIALVLNALRGINVHFSECVPKRIVIEPALEGTASK